MKRILALIIYGSILSLFIVFSYENTSEVMVKFLWLGEVKMPLFVVILAAFILGIITNLAISTPNLVRLHSEINSLKEKLSLVSNFRKQKSTSYLGQSSYAKNE